MKHQFLSKLALGTAQLGQPYGIANAAGMPSEDETEKLLSYAREVGIRLLDTAAAYGDAEKRLGRVGVADFRVVTKVPPLPDHGATAAQWIHDHIEASISRLRVSRLYGVLLHKPSDLLRSDGAELAKTLEGLRDAGVVEKIGVSIYSPSELDGFSARMSIDIVQAPLNVVDRRIERGGWARRLAEAGIELHARSVFLQGLLLMPPESVPAQFLRWAQLFDKWHIWLASEHLEAVQACMGHVAAYSEVTQVVVGCDHTAQLEQIVNAGQSAPRLAPDFLECGDEELINPATWVRT